MIIPFWFRFAQCLNKFYYTGKQANLFNAGKYFSKFIPAFIIMYFGHITGLGTSFILFFTANMIATVYSLYWDYVMDWGVCTSLNADTFLLRNNITYPHWFYYMAMLVNFLLRFFWLFPLILFRNPAQFGAFTVYSLAWWAVFAEILRRTIWALIRVEWEHINT